MATKTKAKPKAAAKTDDEPSEMNENSMPHPETWPSPDTDPDAESPEGMEPKLVSDPEEPNVNLEFTLKGSGLPVNTGVVWMIEGADDTGSPTYLTHKVDPFGDCHVVWRSQLAGTVHVEIMGKADAELVEDVLAELDVDVIDPADDRRLGEARGSG